MAEETARNQEFTNAYLYLLTAMVFFGSAFASSKIVVGHVPSQVAAALRFGCGALVLLAFLAVARSRTPFSWRDAVRAGLVGMLGVCIFNLIFFWALSLAPSIDGSIIVPVLSPVLTTAALAVTGRETASGPRIAGLVLGVAGAVVFFVGSTDTGGEVSGSRLAGDLLFLLGAACWATYTIVSKKVLAGMEPLRATTCATAAGGLGLVLFALPAAPEVDWSGLTASTWANVVYLAIGPTAVAYLFYFRGLRVVSPSVATVMMFAVPVSGITCSMIFLGESFTGVQMAGGGVMLAGSLLAVTDGRLRSSVTGEKAGDTSRIPPSPSTTTGSGTARPTADMRTGTAPDDGHDRLSRERGGGEAGG